MRILAIMTGLLAAGTVQAADINALVSTAIKAATDELLPPIGLQQVSELISNPDVDVIGMLPPELQQITLYSAGVTATARAEGSGSHDCGIVRAIGGDLQGQGPRSAVTRAARSDE